MEWDFLYRWLIDAITWFLKPELVSLAAIILTVVTIFQTRKHNKLSVKPVLSYEIKVHHGWTKVELYVLNSGLGAAILDEYRIKFDGEDIPIKNIKNIGRRYFQNYECDVSYIKWEENTVIPKDSKISVLGLTSRKGQFCEKDLEAFFTKLEITIKYKCLYGEVGSKTITPNPI